jgi:hypothetical protein
MRARSLGRIIPAMHKSWLPALVRISVGFSVLVGTLCLYAGTHRDFQAGKLLDVSSDERLVEGTTVKHAVYEVQLGDIVYFARGERIHVRSGDVGHGLVVGDPVQAAIDGDNLILQRPDGKEIKTKIIQRKRADSGTP